MTWPKDKAAPLTDELGKQAKAKSAGQQPPAMPTPGPHATQPTPGQVPWQGGMEHLPPQDPGSQGNSHDPFMEIRARRLAQALKSGSGNGIPLNDVINGLITGGGLAAPPGVGLGVGAVKGLIEQHQGLYPNTNGMSDAEALAYGPGLGERAGNWVGDQINPQVSANPHPRHGQIVHQSMNPVGPQEIQITPRQQPLAVPTAPDQRTIDQLKGTDMYPDWESAPTPKPYIKPGPVKKKQANPAAVTS